MYAQCLKRHTNNYSHMETGPRHKFSSDRLVKPGILPATPRFIRYTTAAPRCMQTRGKHKRNFSPRQVLAEELGYRKEFGCGGALRFAANALFLALFKSLHIKIPGYVVKSLGIHHQSIMTHTSSGRCVRGASKFIVFWLNYQVGFQSTDCFAPHPFFKIYVSNMPPKHLNLSIPHLRNYSQS